MIQTVDAATLGLVAAGLDRMVLTLRVDNNPTFARIDAPAVGRARVSTTAARRAFVLAPVLT